MAIKRRPWPEKRRKKQAENCRKTKPEQHSTGPKTPEGKATASQNARKHGLRSAEVTELKRLLKTQRELISSLGTE